MSTIHAIGIGAIIAVVIFVVLMVHDRHRWWL